MISRVINDAVHSVLDPQSIVTISYGWMNLGDEHKLGALVLFREKKAHSIEFITLQKEKTRFCVSFASLDRLRDLYNRLLKGIRLVNVKKMTAEVVHEIRKENSPKVKEIFDKSIIVYSPFRLPGLENYHDVVNEKYKSEMADLLALFNENVNCLLISWDQGKTVQSLLGNVNCGHLSLLYKHKNRFEYLSLWHAPSQARIIHEPENAKVNEFCDCCQMNYPGYFIQTYQEELEDFQGRLRHKLNMKRTPDHIVTMNTDTTRLHHEIQKMKHGFMGYFHSYISLVPYRTVFYRREYHNCASLIEVLFNNCGIFESFETSFLDKVRITHTPKSLLEWIMKRTLPENVVIPNEKSIVDW